MGYLEFIMSGNTENLESGIIPAGTRIKLYEGSIIILEDTVVDANQDWIDKAIKDQNEFYNQEKGYMDASSKKQIGFVCMKKKYRPPGELEALVFAWTISITFVSLILYMLLIVYETLYL